MPNTYRELRRVGDGRSLRQQPVFRQLDDMASFALNRRVRSIAE
ncbi:hypothetical protein [Stappia sediminis]|nr:hypothetical protein [Stappia sediminis]